MSSTITSDCNDTNDNVMTLRSADWPDKATVTNNSLYLSTCCITWSMAYGRVEWYETLVVEIYVTDTAGQWEPPSGA